MKAGAAPGQLIKGVPKTRSDQHVKTPEFAHGRQSLQPCRVTVYKRHVPLRDRGLGKPWLAAVGKARRSLMPPKMRVVLRSDQVASQSNSRFNASQQIATLTGLTCRARGSAERRPEMEISARPGSASKGAFLS